MRSATGSRRCARPRRAARIRIAMRNSSTSTRRPRRSCSGSNGSRSRAWKQELQQLADALRLRIHVSHFPPGTSKWNTIEHRLFCHITENWRGRALRTFETVVALIGHTRTAAGLRVKAKLDTRRYPTGCVVTHAEMRALALHPHAFHGDWNYELRPRPS